MDWFLYDNGLRHERASSFRSGVVFHIEKSHLICTANQITSFFIKSNTGLISFKFNMVSRENTLSNTKVIRAESNDVALVTVVDFENVFT